MGFPAKSIWMDGKLIPWQEANIHVLSHVIHYGSCAFDGIRLYANPQGSFILRLRDHMKRLLDSEKRMISERSMGSPKGTRSR